MRIHWKSLLEIISYFYSLGISTFPIKICTRLVTICICFVLMACAENKAWRSAEPTDCPTGENCDESYLAHHTITYEEGKSVEFDLAFVEFTERGNLFDPRKSEEVVNYIKEATESPGGAIILVFTHGWKHNASVTDSNVASFRKLLAKTAAGVTTQRKVIGVYIGWRGQSVKIPLIEELSYWERKNVAEKVGKGGVTEFLLKIERAVIEGNQVQTIYDPNKNIFLVTGHSFGGAIVLAAMNEVVLERIIEASRSDDCQTDNETACDCVTAKPFGHGIVLLNPAIEANEGFRLKQAVASRCFGENQIEIMHIVSSDADKANKFAFPLGQSLGMLKWNEVSLNREIAGTQFTFDENELDTQTVGNFKPFQTAQICSQEVSEGATASSETEVDCETDNIPARCSVSREVKVPGSQTDKQWTYISFEGDPKCVNHDEKSRHIPVGANEPISFVQTDEDMIRDHNDIFTDQMMAYLASIVAKARCDTANSWIASGNNSEKAICNPDEIPDECFDNGTEFNMWSCFEAYQKEYSQFKFE